MAFVRAERLPEITNPDKYVPFAPDLAVEVLSPNDRRRRGRRKSTGVAGGRIEGGLDGRSRRRRRSPFIARVPSPSLSPKIKTLTAAKSSRASYAGSRLFFA